MFLRRIALLALPIALVLTGCSSLTSISVSPSAGGVSVNVGQTAQYKAYGVSQMGSGTPTQEDITNSVQWSVTNPAIASISATGLATGLAPGHTIITAQSGGTTASTDITVVAAGSSGAGSGTASITMIPATATASFVGETTQFIALGNLSGGTTTQDLTSNVSWSSSDVSVATVDKNGLVTAVGAVTGIGTTTITATGTTSTGSLVTATAPLTVNTTPGTVTLPTLSVYLTGSGSGSVTSTSGATGTTISCGTGTTAASCTGSYPLSTLVTLTATPTGTSKFGGWSSNCVTVAGPPPNLLQCNVQMTNNKAVGAVFNP